MEYASKVTTRSHSLYTALKKHYNIELLPHGIDDHWYTTDSKVYSLEPIIDNSFSVIGNEEYTDYSSRHSTAKTRRGNNNTVCSWRR